jgi:hypothetical protein
MFSPSLRLRPIFPLFLVSTLLAVEYVGAFTPVDGVTQVVVRLPDAVIGAPRDLFFKVQLRGPASNQAVIKIAAP